MYMKITDCLTAIQNKLQTCYDDMVEPDEEQFPDRYADWEEADSLFPEIIDALDDLIDSMENLANVRPSANHIRVKPY